MIDSGDLAVSKIVVYAPPHFDGRYMIGTKLMVFKDAHHDFQMRSSFEFTIAAVAHLYQIDLLSDILLMKKDRVAVITGGAGFVGRHFVRRLCMSGRYRIIVVDNLSSDSAIHPKQWPSHLTCPTMVFIQQDCLQFFTEYKKDLGSIDMFIHLAAIVGGRARLENEPMDIAADFAIDAAAFQWASKVRPAHTVYFSSSAVYPVHLQKAASAEDNIVGIDKLLREEIVDISNGSRPVSHPDLTYGWVKLTGEYQAMLLAQKHNLSVSIYRPFSGYGEDQGSTYPFPSIVRRVLDAVHTAAASGSAGVPAEIDIWSNATRDFVYIEDIVSCVLSTYNKNLSRPINLATGRATSMHELATIVASRASNIYNNDDGKIGVRVLPNMPLGVEYRVGSPRNAHLAGCVFPTSLEDGIDITIRHIRNADAHNAVEKEIKRDVHIQSKEKRPTAAINPFPADRRDMYSSHRCIGGSQDMSEFPPDHFAKGFPPSTSSRMRTCHFKNVCINQGEIMYFKDPVLQHLSKTYFPSAGMIDESIFDKLLSVQLPHYNNMVRFDIRDDIPFPQDAPRGPARIGFLDKVSHVWNIGHYLLDNTLPHFVASRIFGLPFDEGVQVFREQCSDYLHDLPTSLPARENVIIDNDLFQGNLRESGLQMIKQLTPFFLNYDSIFHEKEHVMCFPDLIAGQGSTFGIHSIDLSRGEHIKAFRDHLLARMNISTTRSSDILTILIADSGTGYDSKVFKEGVVVPRLCDILIKHSIELSSAFFKTISFHCTIPQYMNFRAEVEEAQKAHIIISRHGTVSYTSLFSQVIYFANFVNIVFSGDNCSFFSGYDSASNCYKST